MLTRLFLGGLAALAFAAPVGAEDAKPEVKVKLEAHRGGVGAIAFSPNSELIATGSGNGVLRLWDTKTGEMVVKLEQVGGTKIVHTAFSADGQILSVTARKSVVAWSLADPKKPRTLFAEGDRESPYKVGGVSGDGKRVYYADLENRTFRFWDTNNSGHSRTDFKMTEFNPLAFATAPDADTALAVILGLGGNDLKPTLAFVGLGDTWQLTDGLAATDGNKTNAIGFSPDGKWLMVCSNGTANVWKVPGSQKVSGKPREVSSAALAAAAGPNNLLAVAERPEGKKVRINLVDLSAETPKTVASFATDIDDVSCLAFSPDGKMLAVADNVEGVVQLWALPAKK